MLMWEPENVTFKLNDKHHECSPFMTVKILIHATMNSAASLYTATSVSLLSVSSNCISNLHISDTCPHCNTQNKYHQSLIQITHMQKNGTGSSASCITAFRQHWHNILFQQDHKIVSF